MRNPSDRGESHSDGRAFAGDTPPGWAAFLATALEQAEARQAAPASPAERCADILAD